jgi:hypothetical protein
MNSCFSLRSAEVRIFREPTSPDERNPATLTMYAPTIPNYQITQPTTDHSTADRKPTVSAFEFQELSCNSTNRMIVN